MGRAFDNDRGASRGGDGGGFRGRGGGFRGGDGGFRGGGGGGFRGGNRGGGDFKPRGGFGRGGGGRGGFGGGGGRGGFGGDRGGGFNNNRASKSPQFNGPATPCKYLFVRNMPAEVTTSAIQQWSKDITNITRRPDDGGFVTLEFASESAATKALQEFRSKPGRDGQSLAIDYDRKAASNQQSPGMMKQPLKPINIGGKTPPSDSKKKPVRPSGSDEDQEDDDEEDEFDDDEESSGEGEALNGHAKAGAKPVEKVSAMAAKKGTLESAKKAVANGGKKVPVAHDDEDEDDDEDDDDDEDMSGDDEEDDNEDDDDEEDEESAPPAKKPLLDAAKSKQTTAQKQQQPKKAVEVNVKSKEQPPAKDLKRKVPESKAAVPVQASKQQTVDKSDKGSKKVVANGGVATVPTMAKKGADVSTDPKEQRESDRHTLFIKNLPRTVTISNIKQIVPGIINVRHTHSSGFAHITFADEAAAVKAHSQLTGKKVGTNTIVVDYVGEKASNKSPKSAAVAGKSVVGADSINPYKLHIVNVPTTCTNGKLVGRFSDSLMTQVDGTGNAFVTFASAQSARAAFAKGAADKYTMDGVKLTLTYAQLKDGEALTKPKDLDVAIEALTTKGAVGGKVALAPKAVTAVDKNESSSHDSSFDPEKADDDEDDEDVDDEDDDDEEDSDESDEEMEEGGPVANGGAHADDDEDDDDDDDDDEDDEDDDDDEEEDEDDDK